jgi:hypothetical protein
MKEKEKVIRRIVLRYYEYHAEYRKGFGLSTPKGAGWHHPVPCCLCKRLYELNMVTFTATGSVQLCIRPKCSAENAPKLNSVLGHPDIGTSFRHHALFAAAGNIWKALSRIIIKAVSLS